MIEHPKKAADLLKVRFWPCLAAGVLLSRAFTSGPAYFADAERHLRAIANHSYVIQPPGYWLFNRLGGFFPDPELGILVLNWCFSAFGCVAFYGCARRLVRRPLAELGSILYGTVFFAWFSGDVHSTYASQLLFAPLTFYFMLRFRENPQRRWLLGVAASYAIGAGLRPSDGLFLAPLLFAFWVQLPREQKAQLLVFSGLFCAAWFIPSQIALRAYSTKDNAAQLTGVATGAMAFGHLNPYTVSNLLRYVLPLSLALGPAVLVIGRARSSISKQLWMWVLPGSVFFVFVYISDAPYLNCILGGVLLLGLLGLDTLKSPRLAAMVIICSSLLNVSFYLGFRPIPARRTVGLVLNKDLGMYSYFAVRNRTMFRLRDMLEAHD